MNPRSGTVVVSEAFGNSGVSGVGLASQLKGGYWAVDDAFLGELKKGRVIGLIQLVLDVVVDKLRKGVPVLLAGDPILVRTLAFLHEVAQAAAGEAKVWREFMFRVACDAWNKGDGVSE